MQPNNLLRVLFCQNFCALPNSKGNKMGTLSKFVNNYPNCIVPLRTPRQSCNKVYCNVLPLLLWNGKGLQQSCRPLIFSLNLLTHKALSHKSSYFSLHAMPQKMLLHVSVHLCSTRMYGVSKTVGFSNQLMSNFYCWDTQPATRMK